MLKKGLEFVKMIDRISKLEHEYLVKHHDDTDEKYGFYPLSRPIDLYIHSGIVTLDKPPGPTSHEVVAWIKRLFRLSRAGHGGTLEPSLIRG